MNEENNGILASVRVSKVKTTGYSFTVAKSKNSRDVVSTWASNYLSTEIVRDAKEAVVVERNFVIRSETVIYISNSSVLSLAFRDFYYVHQIHVYVFWRIISL